jgi:amino acid transporter
MSKPANDDSVIETSAPRQQLSLLDSTSIIVGIIIGSAIYEISPTVAAGAGSHAGMLLVWLAGGLIALLGAMCYAELATAHPHAGGTYVYLSEGLGKSVGFAFAWSEFWIVRPGNVGAVAFVLARYGCELLPFGSGQHPQADVVLASAAVLGLSLVNACGLRAGKWTQNVLTAAKVAGLAAIVVTALTLAPPSQPREWQPDSNGPSLSLALILVMFAYGGWADMSFVAAEVRDPRRNIFRALLLGTAAVTVIYLAVNEALTAALGFEDLMRSKAVAADVLSRRFGTWGSTAISVLVVVSCLGAINGMVFTGARIFYALGTQHPTFRWLGRWNRTRGIPLRSLAVQTLVTLALIIAFGLEAGGFNRLVVFTGPFYWGFFSLVGIVLILLRWRSAGEAGTYRVPLYPLTPLLFIATSGGMTLAALRYLYDSYREDPSSVRWPLLWATAVLLSGLAAGTLDWLARRRIAATPVR